LASKTVETIDELVSQRVSSRESSETTAVIGRDEVLTSPTWMTSPLKSL